MSTWRRDASAADGFNGPTAGLVTSLTATIAVGNTLAGNLVYVWVWRGYDEIDDAEQWEITDTYGNDWDLVATSGEPTFSASGASGSRQALFVCSELETGGASHAFTVTVPDPSHYLRMIVAEYGYSFGPVPNRIVAVSLDQARHSHNNSADAVVMPSVMARDGDHVVSCVQSIDGACTYAAGTGFGHLEGNTTAGAQAAEDQQMTSDGLVTPTFTASASDNSFGMSFVIREPPEALDYTGPYNPPVRNEEYGVAVPFLSALTRHRLPDAPIDVGDIRVDRDGSGLYGIDWLPDFDDGVGAVIIRLDADEMDADVVTVVCIDQSAPKEWADIVLVIPTTQLTIG